MGKEKEKKEEKQEKKKKAKGDNREKATRVSYLSLA